MNLKEFRERTKNMPDNTDIYIGERLTEFKYGLVNSAAFKTISMTEEPDGSGESAKDDVLILEED